MKTKKGMLWLSSAAGMMATIFLGMPMQVRAAGCGKPDFSKPVVSVKLAPQINNGTGQGNRNNSIVGLWHVTYTSGNFGYESFDQWHSDGNEFEVANLGPGAMCQGTWAQVAPGKVQLFHIGWNFDLNGVVNGTFTITQTLTVSADGSTYQGTFDLENYDLDGNLLQGQGLQGTVAATRLTVNSGQ